MTHTVDRLVATAMRSAATDLARDVLAGTSAPCFVIGRNADAERLCAQMNLRGLVDDSAAPGAVWNGLPVIESADLPDGAIVINASTSIRPVDVIRRFANLHGVRLVGLHEVIAASEGVLAWPSFVADQRQELSDHIEDWRSLYDRLTDDSSRQVFCDVLGFRLSADPQWMAQYEVRIEEQYFEDFLALDGETFVDAGGFDGDTTEVFCARDPNYSAVHFFEPSSANMAKARVRLAGKRDIHFHPLALSDKETELVFDPTAGSASSISKDGGVTIHAVPLDDVVSTPVTFIKMDLEGWEGAALLGARKHILASRPKLAIAAYHKATDFREISQFVLGLNPDYRIMLRHYTQGWSETVMFFV